MELREKYNMITARFTMFLQQGFLIDKVRLGEKDAPTTTISSAKRAFELFALSLQFIRVG
jgi:hypothetical protein